MAVAGNDLINYLKQYIGTPYAWGGNDLSSGIDCSGLVQQGLKHFGIDVPRTTYDQIGAGQAVSMKGLRTGDLVFFDTDKKTPGPDHVGVYMGNGKMIEAPRTGKNVQITDITSGYYLDRFMGGRRISGVQAAGQSSSDLATPEEIKMTPQELAASYGWAYGFLNGNKDLKGVFDQAVKGSWSPDRFQAAIRDTKWFKETSSTARQAQVTQSTDPATWAAQINAATVQVQQLAAKIGAAVPQSKLKSIAESVVRTGLDEDGLRNALGQYVNFTKNGTLNGEAGMHEFTMKQYAANNGVTISPQAIKNQAQLVVRKIATTQDFESQIRDQAKSMYPGYAEQLDAGLTMKDVAGPYMSAMSNELEIPDSSITLQDPAIKSALNGLDANGKPTGLNLQDFQTQIRNDPRWRKTAKAQNSVMNIGTKVLSDMGLIPPPPQGG